MGLDEGRSLVKDDWLLWCEGFEKLPSSEVAHRCDAETNPLTAEDIITFVKSHWRLASFREGWVSICIPETK